MLENKYKILQKLFLNSYKNIKKIYKHTYKKFSNMHFELEILRQNS